jgi:hypothetical protein
MQVDNTTNEKTNNFSVLFTILDITQNSFLFFVGNASYIIYMDFANDGQKKEALLKDFF